MSVFFHSGVVERAQFIPLNAPFMKTEDFALPSKVLFLLPRPLIFFFVSTVSQVKSSLFLEVKIFVSSVKYNLK